MPVHQTMTRLAHFWTHSNWFFLLLKQNIHVMSFPSSNQMKIDFHKWQIFLLFKNWISCSQLLFAPGLNHVLCRVWKTLTFARCSSTKPVAFVFNLQILWLRHKVLAFSLNRNQRRTQESNVFLTGYSKRKWDTFVHRKCSSFFVFFVPEPGKNSASFTNNLIYLLI